ncbi:MAG: hypothetical protein CSA35_02435 [Dethiosulfovibrio peptidovorans]|nr:MAG: hypothetical protein CSA35_02435 [Dethiosulfovibrio peptidovorans]
MIQVIPLSWEEFKEAFAHIFREVDRFLRDMTDYTLSIRHTRWSLRIDHDRGWIIFDYTGREAANITRPTGPHLFIIEGCPYLHLS